MSTIVVGIAELQIAKSPEIITTIGLGSCVGVTIYDPSAQAGGLVHVLLPSNNTEKNTNPAKFADTGIPELIRRLSALGVKRSSMVAKIAGGANMFSAGGKSNIFMVGQRNVEMCLEILKKERIRLLANDTGGNYGRTIELNTANGQLRIKTIGHGEKIL
ncbi:MAG: chemotaxis protein CheD [Oscillospiraceae bacterium]